MPRSFVSLVPSANQVAFLEGVETRIQDTSLRKLGLDRSLRRFDSIAEALEHLAREVLDCRTRLGESPRVDLLLDASDFSAGQSAARETFEIARRLPRTSGHCIEIVPGDVAKPEHRGWRVVIGRRDVVAALVSVTAQGRLQVAPGVPLAAELRQQIERFRARAVRPGDDDGEGEDLARAVALQCYTLSRVPARTAG
jgi:hypothetical protein